MANQKTAPNRSQKTRTQKASIFFFVVAVGLIITLMNIGARLSDKDLTPADLTTNPTLVQQKIKDNSLRSVARLSINFDDAFIVAYVGALYFALASIPTSPTLRFRRFLNYAGRTIAVAGGIFDVLDECALKAGYESRTTWLSPHIQSVTTWKFRCFFAAAALLIFLAAVKDKPIRPQLARWARAVYFLRVPILVMGALIILPFMDASSSTFAEMSRGIFAVEGPFELGFAALAAFLLSWSAMI